ncbi:HNH endonuclease [Vibrio lentus]|uniref:HNH endonuclease n=1 Tax=Vibrio lentus TaxID=136468 RepID=UPI003D0F6941
MDSKVTRICWNSNNWKYPSGPEGKSKDASSFEVEPGYGHEEWIFDLSKLISGFKYSFLQGINTPKKSHQGRTFKISLFCVYEGKKLCVGHIDNVECLTREQALLAVKEYNSNDWFKEMHQQLVDIDIPSPRIIEDDPLFNFNIRFSPHDLVIYDNFIDISSDYNSTRYKLFDDVRTVNSQTTLSSDILDLTSRDLSDTEKQQLISSRVGQGVFRDNVTSVWGGEHCAVTLVNVREMLIASHIKPWSKCETKDQRLDGANGLLLCAHIDKLFDRHLLSFECRKDRFLLRVSRTLDKKLLSSLAIDEGVELNTQPLGLDELARFKNYMKEHFEVFSIKNSSEAK